MALKYDLKKLGSWCVWLMALSLVFEFITNVHSEILLDFFVKNDAFHYAEYSDAEFEALASWIDLLGTVSVVCFMVPFIIGMVLNLVWIYRASSNAGAIQPEVDRITPKMAVIWNFIPFANLVMPYRAIRELWNSTFDPNGDIGRAGPSFFGLWWAAWLISNIVSNNSLKTSMKNDWNVSRLSNTLDWVTLGLSIIAVIFFIKIIRSVTDEQTRLSTQPEIREK
jgi:hypothetical protein